MGRLGERKKLALCHLKAYHLAKAALLRIVANVALYLGRTKINKCGGVLFGDGEIRFYLCIIIDLSLLSQVIVCCFSSQSSPSLPPGDQDLILVIFPNFM